MKTIFFGGAFDPFHSQHRALIEAVRRELCADRVVVYPSYEPPHKAKLSASFALRVSMAKLATADLDYVSIDELECERDTVNYSYEVIPLLKQKYPSDEYGFLIGGDSLRAFSTWVHPELIAKEIPLVVAGRGKTDMESAANAVRGKYGAEVTILNFCGQEVSSSEIKARADLGLPQKDVCPAVEKIILDNGLYRDYAPIVDKLRLSIPEKTFSHVCRTVLYALKLNTGLNLPYKKVFLAALLHDCTKHILADMEDVPPAVVHQYTGSEAALHWYGVEEDDILAAIRCHTTGKPNMTTLEKLIFCADMLEEGRSYPGVERLRETIESDFEKGFRACVKSSYNNLLTSGKQFDPLTKSCALYYNVTE